MRYIAVILTVHNRLDKTVACLNAVFNQREKYSFFNVDVFLTDDGSTDDTSKILRNRFSAKPLHILSGNGNLYWNGGMINSWKAAIEHGGYDGYLWLNNDTIVLPNLWNELEQADEYSRKQFAKGGIYVGSTKDPLTGEFTYGGFEFTNQWTLKDRFLHPNGHFQLCQCAHGNVTYISHDVVEKMGILCEQYLHGGGDHDYTYLAYKAGFPLIVLKDYVGICENDHQQGGYADFLSMSLKQRIKYLYSPLGFNLHNTLLLQKRCFPYRYPFVWLMGYLKAFFPKMYFKIYSQCRN
jgi:GT2 family glycosyltransferase